VCKYNVYDTAYTQFIQGYLSKPKYLRIYKEDFIWAIKIIKEVFKNNVCEFYMIREYLNNTCALDNLLKAFDLKEMVDVIRILDHFFDRDKREMYIDTVSNQLNCAIQDYWENLDAYDFDPDVDGTIIRLLVRTKDAELVSEVNKLALEKYKEDTSISAREHFYKIAEEKNLYFIEF
jgi:hypothetical protein